MINMEEIGKENDDLNTTKVDKADIAEDNSDLNKVNTGNDNLKSAPDDAKSDEIKFDQSTDLPTSEPHQSPPHDVMPQVVKACVEFFAVNQLLRLAKCNNSPQQQWGWRQLR